MTQIQKHKIQGYKWACPVCKKEIKGTTEKRIKYLINSHKLKHEGEG